MKRFVSTMMLFITMVSVMSGASNLPLPDIDISRFLFKIKRSRNANEVIYELNMDANNRVNGKEPIKVYWLKKTDHHKTEPLTSIQQNYSYGIKYSDQTNYATNEWYFHLIAYPQKTLVLKTMKNNTFKVTTTAGNQEIFVKRIFIQFENNSFWFPSISSVILYGQDILTNKMIAETLK